MFYRLITVVFHHFEEGTVILGVFAEKLLSSLYEGLLHSLRHVLSLSKLDLMLICFDSILEIVRFHFTLIVKNHVGFDRFDDFCHKCWNNVRFLNHLTNLSEVIMDGIAFLLERTANKLVSSLPIKATERNNRTYSLSSQESRLNELNVVGGEQANNIHSLSITTVQGIQNILHSGIPITSCYLINLLY